MTDEPARFEYDAATNTYSLCGGLFRARIPAPLTPHVRALVRDMAQMNATMDDLQKLVEAAQDEADATHEIQTPWYGVR